MLWLLCQPAPQQHKGTQGALNRGSTGAVQGQYRGCTGVVQGWYRGGTVVVQGCQPEVFLEATKCYHIHEWWAATLGPMDMPA